MQERKFLVLVHEASDTGGYWAEVPELPGCVTQSDTLDELKRDIREAIELYLEDEACRMEIVERIAGFDSDKLLRVLTAIDDIEFEPNDETIAAMEAPRDPNEKLYDSFDDLMDEVEAEVA